LQKGKRKKTKYAGHKPQGMDNNFSHELVIKPSVDTRGLYDEYFIKRAIPSSSGIAGCEGDAD